MSSHSRRHIQAQLLALAVSAAVAGIVAAASLNINPSTITDTYDGVITYDIGGVTSGQTVVVEKYADSNGNGAVDPTDIPIQSFRVTDGEAFSVAGVRDVNVPGDEDGAANGQIRTVIDAQIQSEVGRVSGDFLIRISPADGGFSPVVAALTIEQADLPQGVSGQVTADGSPVPAAFVVLLDPRGGSLAGGALADSTGQFSLRTAPGTYLLWAFKRGFVSDAGAVPPLTISAGAFETQNLTLSPANRTIAGRVTDASSGAGIPGVQIIGAIRYGDPSTLVFTDANGDFDIPVSTLSNQWELILSRGGCTMLGYLRSDATRVDISEGDVSGVAIQLAKVTALFYGSLKNSLDVPLAGIEIEAKNPGTEGDEGGFGRTDAGGNYAVGVVGGNWGLSPSSDDPGLAGYVVSRENRNISEGQAIRVDFVAQAPCAHLRGHVTDNAGTPISNVAVVACPSDGICPYVRTDADGSFDFGVAAGNWSIFVYGYDLIQRGLVGTQLYPIATCGVDQNNLVLEVRHTTAQINGTVKDTGNDAVPSLNVYAYSMIDGLVYGVSTDTNSSGNYTLPVANGTWQVGVDCDELHSRGYICPTSQQVVISGANATLNFTVQSPLQVTTTSLPDAVRGFSYGAQLNAAGGTMPYHWDLAPGSFSLPPGINLSTSGYLSGTPTTAGEYGFTVRVTDSGLQTADRPFSLLVKPAFATATPTRTRTPTPTITVTPTATSTPTITPTQKVTFPGDSDCNGELDAADVTATTTAIFDPIARALCNADCNEDGEVTAADVVCVAQKIGTPG